MHAKQINVYHAIADPNRRKLLDLISEKERSVQELVPYFRVTIGAISQHLKILLDNQLVVVRKKGRYRYYRVKPKALKDVNDWTNQYSKFWNSRLERLGDYLDNNP